METAARALIDARRLARPVPRLTLALPDLTEDDAYRIAATVASRDEAAIIGYKLGYTSRAMREQMGITEPNYGVLAGKRLSAA